MGLFSAIFGGSKSKQTSKSQSTQSSSNQAFAPISNAFSPLLGETAGAMKDYNAFLGGDMTGFNQYKANTGYNFLESEGMRNIGGAYSGKGAFQSGAAAKSLQKYGSDLQNTYAQSWLDRLLGRAGIGLQAGNLMTGAGGMSQGQSTAESLGTSKSTPGIAGFLGSIMGGIGGGGG